MAVHSNCCANSPKLRVRATLKDGTKVDGIVENNLLMLQSQFIEGKVHVFIESQGKEVEVLRDSLKSFKIVEVVV